ncbi:non-ribosomal peptide synthetase [Bradyrhizobium sp. Ec3.3]|uniref:non-ribosomal peptide synthetase n=1 Tax=Bradyrhizobium sp. Ec3.3 TaxID=189753 RepID=UPI00040EE4F5|nr:non-ribosomal peptide synthetase [Bradyrhizobium sp. Ec3.3]
MNVQQTSEAATISGFRLSPSQWELWRRQSKTGALLSRARLTIGGGLDADWLAECLADIVERNDILRAAFRQLPGMEAPLQVIQDDTRPVVETYDWRACDPTERESRLRQLWTEKPAFDLHDGPLLAAALARTGEHEQVLQLVAPSIVADSESLALILREVAARANGAAPGPRAEVQFLHLSEWCHEVREDQDNAARRNFWRDQIDQHLLLPFARIAAAGAVGEAHTEGPVSDRSMVLAAWALVLGRYAASREVTIHCRLPGRMFDELADAVGPMATSVPIRITWSADETLSLLTERIDRSLAEASENLPYFEGRSASSEPAQIGFDYQEAPEFPTAPTTSFRNFEMRGEIEPCDLLLRGVLSGGRLRLDILYDTNRHDGMMVGLLADALQATLENAHATAPLQQVPAIGPRECDLLLNDWSHTTQAPIEDVCIHALFARIARERPAEMAVKSPERQLTFAELDACSNQLARHLQAAGVRPEARVAILLKRGADLIVAVLGVLKAGAAYVPLDPDNPPQRIAALMDAASVSAVIVNDEFPELPARSCSRISLSSPSLDVCSALPLPAADDVRPSNAAYVIFTSGSTGTPKAVVVEHRSAVNLAAALQERIYSGRGDHLTVSVNAPLSFDASVKQIVQLLNGHCLCIVPETARQDGEELLNFIVKSEIDVLDCTPSHLKLLMSAGFADWNSAYPSVVLVGGEAIDAESWTMLARHRATFFNVYGPTEATVNASAERVTADVPPNIGRPLRNVRIYILDADLSPVPVGVAGELCIGGAGLARGYLGNRAATAERFVPDPFGADNERLYRSGDSARFLADGRIAFLGRLDDQVKVRGYRIEPGEIAAAMREHPAIEEALVVARGEVGDRRLVAYARCRDAATDAASFKSTLAQLNSHETEYLYDEIFTKEIYVRHDIRLRHDACVLDVGANIGMFSAYVARRCRRPRLYAFEPLAPIFERLAANLARHAPSAKLFPIGLSRRQLSEEFTFYPGYSMMSGQKVYSDAAGEVTTIKQYLRNEEAAGQGSTELIAHVDELLAERFRPVELTCQLRRLSDVIREEAIERIDLLKIDVQRAELDVLQGIDDDDWPRIQQVAMEVHDQAGTPTQGRIDLLLDLLENRGFEVRVEQESLLQGTDRYSLYAWRPEYARSLSEDDIASALADPPSPAEMRGFLAERLPDYMLPAAFVVLAKFPLTRNGKVDLTALPEPGARRLHLQGALAGPENVREEAMVEIWKEVLGLDEIGVEDNFFQLGGDSIRSIQVQALAQRRGLRFGLSRLFARQTIRELVRDIDVAGEPAQAGGTAAAFGLVRAEDRARMPADAEDAYPLSALQAGMVYHTELTGRPSTYHNATSHRLLCRLEPDMLRGTIDELIAAHPVLRTSFHLTGFSEPLQIVHREMHAALEIRDLSTLTADEQYRVIDADVRAELQRPFKWDKAPLVRFGAYRIDPSRFQLMVAEYHGILDGWSLHLLLAEICQRYARRLCLGATLSLDPPRLTYRRFVEIEREAQTSDEVRQFWSSKLADAPRAQLPRRNGALSQRGRVEGHEVELADETSSALSELSRRIAVPLKSIMLAIHVRVIALACGSRDVVTGLVVNGRPEEAEGDRIIGLFINTVPFRMSLNGGSWLELARLAFAQESELVPHRRLPFADIQRMHGGSPLIDSFFNFSQFHLLPGQTDDAPVTISESRTVPADIDFPLAVDFEVKPGQSEVRLSFQYDAERFSAEQIARLGGCYRKAIDAFLRDPHAAWDEAVLEEPTSDIEGQIGRIWSDVLGHPGIGRDDAFAAVGGHSLLAIRIVARIRQELGCDLPLSALCGGTSIAALAHLLNSDRPRLEVRP